MKIRFPISMPELGDAELLWAESVDGGARILNIPLLLFGISRGDIVKTAIARGILEFDGVVRRGGHSTYRLMIEPNALDGVMPWWSELASHGCMHEDATARFWAIDVPPGANIYAVYDVLERGMAAGVWLFEEGHVGHPLRPA